MSDSIQMPNQSTPAPSSSMDIYYQREVDLKRRSDISLTTDQGDKITISNSFENRQSLEYEGHFSAFGQNRSIASSNLSIGSYSLVVEGDLNEEELADIKDLLKDLTKISRSFFQGNLDKAMTGAVNIGDTGTINEFSASFSYNYIETTSLLENRTLPAQDENAATFSGLKNFLQDDTVEIPSYGDILKGQWEQVREVLVGVKKETENEIGDNAPDNKDIVKTANKLMDRMTETLTAHPRLSPLALPMASRIIDQLSAEEPGFREKNGLGHKLHNQFNRAYNNWLNTV